QREDGRVRGQFAGRWTIPYLANILNDWRVTGRLQPKRKKNRRPEGDMIEGYYPRIISDADFYAARGARETGMQGVRKVRRGKHLDLFPGLLIDARSGTAYTAVGKDTENKGKRRLVTYASTQGEGPAYSFPVATFEHGMVDMLLLIEWRELLA